MNENGTYIDDLGDENLPNAMRENPFVVPTDFFENQESAILGNIQLEKRSITDINTSNSIPKDYFESLQNNILAKIAESKINKIVQENGFVVPDNYFNELESNINCNIQEQNLKNIIQNEGFETPGGYFEDLEKSIFAKISEESLKSKIQHDGFTTPSDYFESLEESVKANISLDKVAFGNEFEVPKGYFEELEAKIVEKTKQLEVETENITIGLPKRRIINWRSLSAAAVLLLVGIGTYLSINENIPTQTALANYETNFQEITDDDLVKYLAQELEGDDLLQLTQIVEEKTGEPVHINTDMKEDDIEEYLNYML